MDTAGSWRCWWFFGCCLALWYIEQGNKRNVNPDDEMNGSYLGSEFNQDEIEKELKLIGAEFDVVNYHTMIDKTSEYLSQEKATGWFQGEWNLALEL